MLTTEKLPMSLRKTLIYVAFALSSIASAVAPAEAGEIFFGSQIGRVRYVQPNVTPPRSILIQPGLNGQLPGINRSVTAQPGITRINSSGSYNSYDEFGTRSVLRNSVLINPKIINSEIEDSVLVNPVIVAPPTRRIERSRGVRVIINP